MEFNSGFKGLNGHICILLYSQTCVKLKLVGNTIYTETMIYILSHVEFPHLIILLE